MLLPFIRYLVDMETNSIGRTLRCLAKRRVAVPHAGMPCLSPLPTTNHVHCA
jgi:hypothetical protein